MSIKEYDVLIVGGGINGATSVANLSYQGLKLALVEQRDYASMTSQASSNMIWGGIKYLQSAEFSLVRALCESRNRLLQAYPSRVREIAYFTSFYKGNPYSSKLIYAGAWFYWLMGGCQTFKPRYVKANQVRHEAPLLKQEGLNGAVSYADAYLPDNDARFVYQFIRDGQKRGAKCFNYTRLETASYVDGWWLVDLLDLRTSQKSQIRARSLVNACGPQLKSLSGDIPVESQVAFSKGVHLIVPKIGPSDRVLTFFSKDGRLFFVLPMGNRSCIGTTDTRVRSHECEVTQGDREFILENINSYLNDYKDLSLKDIISERCGVRTLIVDGDDQGEDWIKLTRKHKIEVDKSKKSLTIVGGKITDCLNVGEEVGEAICEMLQERYREGVWYGESSEKEKFIKSAQQLNLGQHFDGLSMIEDHLWRRYGSEAFTILDLIKDDQSLANEVHPGSGYIKAEFVYMAKFEQITCLEDVLRRRTTLAMEYKEEEMDLEMMKDLLGL
ncbi:Glycerol-3-phosphate dehydrogenase [Lentisphaera araneosa HTCC2155]|uniref:Glycerol-3-phosphate dehydrogenase n=1 Tax=Lentisphaera araneosa HTCC2155 TaxID=313628 RepID=A6DS09_9BACT|nr:glycerol-3-phosphate dehydrogenase/oxidase [Lentisphaera araneosa]EDM25584.1 Glycerol-3-phosphate dehydrogenase [Lentisphaera araneosa HTCC2155]